MDNWLGLDARPRMTAEEATIYERKRARGRSRELTQTTVKVSLAYFSYFLADILLLGDVTTLSAVLRFGVVLPLVVGLLLYLRRARPILMKEYATLALVIAANLVWCIILSASANPMAINYFYGGVLFQMVVTIGIRAPFHASLAATLACFLVNYGFMPFISGSNAAHGLYYLALYLPAVVQTLIVSYQLEAERQLNFLQMHENENLKMELSRQNGALERLALTDPLTQLPNRRGTDAELARLRDELAPNEVELSTVLIIDIDHFKAYNDGYGHNAGDECLVKVARAMRRELPSDVHLARHGGEEFLAVIPDCDRDVAVRYAENLRRTVRAQAIPHAHASGRNNHVTVSIGVACGSISGEIQFERLLEAADRALYQVKGEGRNGWRLADMPQQERLTAGRAGAA